MRRVPEGLPVTLAEADNGNGNGAGGNSRGIAAGRID
jgi:hypothetical protein